MILKTNTDDFGRMGFGFNNSFKGMFNGDFFKKQNLLSDSDISAIKAYNAEIDKCVTSQTAFNRTMLNTSQQAQNVVAAANGNKVALEGMTKASKAAELGMKALSIAGNMIATMVISWVLSEAISWLNDLAHAEENARKRSEELTSSYEDEKKNIDDSIAKYKELSEKLNDSSLSTSEVKSIKEQLLSVQDQLNEKYGAEATQIDLVNGKYNEQIKKLDALAKKKAGDYVSENYKDIQADQKYVSEKVNLDKSLGFKGSQARPDDYSNAGFDLKKYLDRYDKLSAEVVSPDGQYGMTGDVNLVTNGTRQEVYDQLSQLFQDLSNDFGNSNEDVNKFKTTISGILEDSFDTDALDSANDRIKKYTQAEILSNDNTSASYNNLVNAVDNYNTALSSGKGVDDAKQKLLEAKQAAEDSTKDITNSGKVLHDVYNSLDNEAPIELQVEFGKNVDEDLQQSYEDTINRFKDSYKIKDFFDTEGINTQEEINAFNNVTEGIVSADAAIQKWIEHKKEANKETVSLSLNDFKDIKDDLQSLQTAFTELSDDGHISIDTLSSIKNIFQNSVDNIDEYINILSTAKKGSDEFNQALSDLTYGYLSQKISVENLANSNETLIATMLKDAGISNADEVATFAVTRAKEELRIKTELVSATTANAIIVLATEATQAGITGQAFNDLVLNVGIFNNANLDVSQKVEALKQLGYYASWAGQQINNIKKVSRQNVNGQDFIASYDESGNLIGVEAVKEPENYNIPEPKVVIPTFKTSSKGSNNDNKSSKDKSEKKPKEYEDHRTYADLFEEILSDKEKAIDNVNTKNDYLNKQLEIALSNGDLETARVITEQLNANSENIKSAYSNYATSLRDIYNNQIMAEIVGMAREFGYAFDGMDIVDISDVDVENIRQKLQDEINRQKDIGVDMENKEEGDNAFGIKTAELALDKWNELIDDANSYYDAVGSQEGQGEFALKYWEEVEKIYENNLKLAQAHTDEMEKQTTELEHQITLLENQGYTKNAEGIRNYIREQQKLVEESSKWIRNELENNYFSYSTEGIEELKAQLRDNGEKWWDYDNAYAETYSKAFDEKHSNSEDWISHEEAMNRLTVQGKLDAYDRMLKAEQDYQKQIIADETISQEKKDEMWKESEKRQQELEENKYDVYIDTAKTAYDAVMDMIEYNYDSELSLEEELHDKKMDDYDEELKKIQEIYKTQKENLQDMKDEDDYQRQLTEKQEEANNLKNQLNGLKGDDTDAINSKRIELQKKLNDKLEEIEDLKRDREYEKTTDALDKDLEEIEKYYDDLKNKEDEDFENFKKELDEKYSEANKHKMAMEALQNNYFTLLRKDGVKVSGDLTTAFNAFAIETGSKFDDLGITFDQTIQKLEKIVDLMDEHPEIFDSGKLNTKGNNSSSNTTSSNTSNGTSSKVYAPKNQQETAIVDIMKDNSKTYNRISDSAYKKDLHAANERLGAQIGAEYDEASGKWYKDGCPLYHTGRIVGSDEELAIIQKAETILTPDQFKAAIGNLNIGTQALNGLKFINSQIPNIKNNSNNSSVVFNSNITIRGNADREIIEQANDTLLQKLNITYGGNRS